jgi:hypothetical protein
MAYFFSILLGARREAKISNWIYWRLCGLNRSGWSGSYSNPPEPGSAGVLRALRAAILRRTSSLDPAVGEVSAATGLPT